MPRQKNKQPMSALQELLLKMADDALVTGHRNSEWTGLGPILEEDIAFSSMAQDQIGHALSLYTILHEQQGFPAPDEMAFLRSVGDVRCCHFVELPIGEYDFSLMRHFLYDHAAAIRFDMLSSSSYEPLARLSRKIKGELKYHVLHANSWITRLGHGTEESHARMQSALQYAMPFALGLFETGDDEEELIAQAIFQGEELLQEYWEKQIRAQLQKAGLDFPEVTEKRIACGGRVGNHTVHLSRLLEEMAEVIKLEEGVEW